MANRWFKRDWAETRGDAYDSWGRSVWYFEVGDDGWPIRQIEAYTRGPTMRYGPDHEEDEYGFLGQAGLEDLEDWSGFAITEDEFEEVWSSKP